jgi:hypothetical protein
MKRRLLLLFLTAALGWAIPATADVYLLSFTGFDYSVPNRPLPTDYLQVGDLYYSLGTITSVGPYLTSYVDFNNNWYTYYMFNLKVLTRTVNGTSIDAVFDNTFGGRTRYYEDSKTTGTAPVYGMNPPNATAPSTFIDGTVALGGKTYNFEVIYDYGTGQGDIAGNMDLDEGSDLIYIPVASRPGWVIGGISGAHSLSGPPNTSVPLGYDHQVNGECDRQSPTPASHHTWGAIKALYH